MTKIATHFNARITRLNAKAAHSPGTNNCKGLKNIVKSNKISSSGTQKKVVSIK